jgi:hypothetical protein
VHAVSVFRAASQTAFGNVVWANAIERAELSHQHKYKPLYASVRSSAQRSAGVSTTGLLVALQVATGVAHRQPGQRVAQLCLDAVTAWSSARRGDLWGSGLVVLQQMKTIRSRLCAHARATCVTPSGLRGQHWIAPRRNVRTEFHAAWQAGHPAVSLPIFLADFFSAAHSGVERRPPGLPTSPLSSAQQTWVNRCA